MVLAESSERQVLVIVQSLRLVLQCPDHVHKHPSIFREAVSVRAQCQLLVHERRQQHICAVRTEERLQKGSIALLHDAAIDRLVVTVVHACQTWHYPVDDLLI